MTEPSPNVTATLPVKPRVIQPASNLAPTDRQREVGRLKIKAARQVSAAIGTWIAAMALEYGVALNERTGGEYVDATEARP